MRRAALALTLFALPACAPLGLSGEYEQATFTTGTYCFPSCPYLASYALGGDYSIGVTLDPDVCPADPWTVVATSVEGADFTLYDYGPDEPRCYGQLRFHAGMVGPFRLTAQAADGRTLDTIGLRIAAPDAITITDGTASPWTPRDAPRLTVPHGVLVELVPVVTSAGALLVSDPALLTWSFDGAVEAAGERGGSGVVASRMYAARVGEGTARVTLGGLSSEVIVDVRPVAEGDVDRRVCLLSHEICDGLDNDCDGEVDGDLAAWGCAVRGHETSCVAGRCEVGACLPGWADCEGDDGRCDTSLAQPTSCGACGVVCADGEACVDGACS